MKQVTQRLRDGRIEVLEVPPPEVSPAGVLVDVRASLLSAGTERSKVVAGRKGLLAKARARPDEVRKVVEKMKRDGVAETVSAVRARLDQPTALGYSASGIVLEVGGRVSDLRPGDRVACGGGGYAVHAEIDHVPANLCVRLPESVDFEAGAFATLGAIAMHGVRLAEVSLGERVAVIGLGLVGQLAGQILRAGGCRVLGIDLEEGLVQRALEAGAADEALVRPEVSGAPTCDAVLITAATPSSDPVQLAASLCRDRALVVIVGDVGVDVDRDAYYAKELQLRFSRSYGPGRYDVEYEERGLDYPVGYVRWTERRNMSAFVDLVAARKVDVHALVTQRFPLERASEAYDRLVSAEQSPLALVLEYGETPREARRSFPTSPAPVAGHGVSVVGAGSFASRILVPGLLRAGFELCSVASATGLSARALADSFSFAQATTVDEVIADPAATLIAIATRHDSHAHLAVAALDAGKAVFVEKPPCLTDRELDDLRAARDRSGLALAVGYNRRFAPLAGALRTHIRLGGDPFQLLYRINTEPLPADHWANDLEHGGGRLLGEGCHFVDFACWFAGDLPQTVACSVHAASGDPIAAAQSFVIGLEFSDGSMATILYGSGGARGLEKEYVEVHGGGRSGILRDFGALELLGEGRRRVRRRRRADKGHAAQFVALRRWLEGQVEAPSPDPLETMGVTLTALRAAETGRSIWSSSRSSTSTIRADA